jgi:3-oxosteroid 1-dehydrogenase
VAELQQDGDRVSGVVLKNGKTFSAKQAVILAAGGFDHNQQLREKYLPNPTNADNSSGVITNTGDLLLAAQKLGAATALMGEAWWAPTVMTPWGTDGIVLRKIQTWLDYRG